LNPPVKTGRKTIRIVMAEDQGMVLGAFATLLEIEGDISIVAPKELSGTICPKPSANWVQRIG